MRTLQLTIVGVVLMFAAGGQATAAPVTFLHGTGDFSGGFGGSPAHFDIGLFTFAPQTTNQLTITGASGFIDPSFHGPYPVIVELFNGSTWVSIFNTGNIATDTNLAAIFTGPISFPTITATALRLTSDSSHGYNYHGVASNMQYTLNDAAVATPEPASLAIWGGLGLVGLFAARRRRRVKQAATT